MNQEETKPETTTEASPTEPVSDVTEVFNSFTSYLPESLVPYWEQLQGVPLVGFLMIVAVGYVIAKIALFLFSKSLSQITRRTKSDVDDELMEIMRKPLFLTVFFFFLGVAVKTIGLSAAAESNLIRILASILTVTWMMRGFKVLHVLLDALSRNKERFEIVQPKTIPLFELVGKILLIGLGSYILLVIWGINPTAWLASAGVVGIAVGFAAKDTLANLFSGFFIIADTPYKVGDFINLPSGERGQVTNVGLRSTRILTRDDIEITVPNNVIGNAKVVNESTGRWEKSRIRIPVGVAYGSDLEQVCEILKKVATDHPEVVKNPAPRARMRAFGASSLDLQLQVWIEEPVMRGRLIHELHLAIYQAFNEAGVEIPYQKQEIYIKEFPDRPS